MNIVNSSSQTGLDVKFDKCKNIEKLEMNSTISDCGNLLVVNVDLCNVRCNRFIALAVLVFENNVIKCYKTRKIYTGNKSNKYSFNINAGKFIFVFPEQNICISKDITVKLIAHYTDISNSNCNYCKSDNFKN